jgi:type I restriction enzyme, S subunit
MEHLQGRYSALPLRRVFSIVNGGTPTSDADNWDGGINWFTPEDLYPRFAASARHSKRTLSKRGLATCSATLAPRGSVVLTTRAPIGNLGLLEDEAAVNQGCRALVPKPGTYSRFYAYVLEAFAEELRSLGQGSTFQEISSGGLASLRVPAPPFGSQLAIADYLDHSTSQLDVLIEKKQRAIELIRSRRSSSIGRLLLGFESRNPSMSARDWADALPTKWPVTTLGKCLVRATYGFTNPMPSVDEGPYLLTANDIGDGEILYSTARRTSEAAFVSAITEKSRPRLGDVLVTKDGTLGRTACADGSRACINQSVALLRPSPGLNSDYLAALLRAGPYQELMAFQAGGTTIKHIYVTRIVKMPIPVPSAAEQCGLASEVRAIDTHHDEALRCLERSLSVIQERRRALITAAVTGQLDIPEVG